jgi:hypothetical protein
MLLVDSQLLLAMASVMFLSLLSTNMQLHLSLQLLASLESLLSPVSQQLLVLLLFLARRQHLHASHM